jgi:hypothetical protein
MDTNHKEHEDHEEDQKVKKCKKNCFFVSFVAKKSLILMQNSGDRLDLCQR